MRQWKLDFTINKEEKVYEITVPEEAQPLLEEHPYLGISFKRRSALQMFSQEEAEGVSEKLMFSDPERRIPAARLFFRYLEMITGPEVLQIPFGIGGFLHMEEWKAQELLLIEEEGSVYLMEDRPEETPEDAEEAEAEEQDESRKLSEGFLLNLRL